MTRSLRQIDPNSVNSEQGLDSDLLEPGLGPDPTDVEHVDIEEDPEAETTEYPESEPQIEQKPNELELDQESESDEAENDVGSETQFKPPFPPDPRPAVPGPGGKQDTQEVPGPSGKPEPPGLPGPSGNA